MNNNLKQIKKIREKIRHLLFGNLTYDHIEILNELDYVKSVIGRHESRLLKNIKVDKIEDVEFRIYSQFGEDGIIQYLINKIPIKNKTFIEFGVGSYSESNTRFLLVNNNWKGLIIDNSEDHIDYLSNDFGKDIKYRYDIHAVKKHLTIKNINTVFKENRFTGDIGILSIDVDGIDYWLFEAISVVSPRIIVVEYNSIFGNKLSVTVPYKSNFDRSSEHFSNLFFGASIQALIELAKKRGYLFVGSNSAGNNAFFVKKEFSSSLKPLIKNAKYVKNSYRESKNEKGDLTYVNDHKDRLKIIQEQYLFDLKTKKNIKIKNLYSLN